MAKPRVASVSKGMSFSLGDGLPEAERNAGEPENTYILRPVFQQRQVTGRRWQGMTSRALCRQGRELAWEAERPKRTLGRAWGPPGAGGRWCCSDERTRLQERAAVSGKSFKGAQPRWLALPNLSGDKWKSRAFPRCVPGVSRVNVCTGVLTPVLGPL